MSINFYIAKKKRYIKIPFDIKSEESFRDACSYEFGNFGKSLGKRPSDYFIKKAHVSYEVRLVFSESENWETWYNKSRPYLRVLAEWDTTGYRLLSIQERGFEESYPTLLGLILKDIDSGIVNFIRSYFTPRAWITRFKRISDRAKSLVWTPQPELTPSLISIKSLHRPWVVSWIRYYRRYSAGHLNYKEYARELPQVASWL